MAHGSLYMIAAYVGFAAFEPLYASDATHAYAWYLAVLAGIAAAAVLGVVMQVTLLGWMQGQELRQALVTIGISIIVADQILANFGGNPFQFWAPDTYEGAPVPVAAFLATASVAYTDGWNETYLVPLAMLAGEAADIATFYESIIGDSPYPSFTLAVCRTLSMPARPSLDRDGRWLVVSRLRPNAWPLH